MKFYFSCQVLRKASFPSFLTVFVILLCASNSSAQYASGLYNSNYSGIHGSINNPAFGPHGFLGWDVNIASAELFAATNYASISNSNLFGALSNINDITLDNNEDPLPAGSRSIQFNSADGNKYFSTKLDVIGPSAYLEFAGFGFGFFSRLRAEASSYRIPSLLGFEQYGMIPLNEATSIQSVQAAGLSWSEFGLNLATTRLREDQSLSVGISLKYLVSYEAFQLSTIGVSSFTKVDNNMLQLNSAVAQLAISQNLSDGEFTSLQTTGRSLGVDLGLSLDLDRVRFGFSILDIGKVVINEGGELNRLVVNDPTNIDVDLLTSRESPRAAIDQLNETLQTNGTDSLISRSGFSVGLPTRISIAVDYMVRPDIYTSFQFNQRIVSSDQAIHSNNSFTVAPRFEKRWFMISMPISIFNYKKVHFGLATRLGLLTIGSDDILSLFGNRDFNGTSIYAAIKINPFKNSSGVKGKNVQCPTIKRSPWNSHEPEKTARKNQP